MNVAIAKYFNLCGERINKTNSMDASEIKTCINDYVKGKMFEYTYESMAFDENQCPDLFICRLQDGNYNVIKKEKYGFVNITKDDAIDVEKIYNREIFFFKKHPIIKDENELYEVFQSMTPKQGLWGIPLIVFSLLSPFYSNIFNSRLMYSDSSYSFFFVSSIFIIILILETVLKSSIYALSANQIKKNNILCSMYWLDFIKVSRCRSASIKIRTVDSSLNYIWESFSIIIIDVCLVFLFFTCLSFLFGKYIMVLLGYYAILVALLIYVRFKNYKRSLKNNANNYEKLGTNLSIEEKRDELKYLNDNHFKDFYFNKCTTDERSKYESQIENHHWSELIKANSFISIVVLYTACYFSVKNGDVSPAIVIALMIINSRLSSCLVNVTNRCYMAKIQIYHLKESLAGLFKERRSYMSFGINIDHVKSIEIDNLTVKAGENTVLSNLTRTLHPGDILGIYGPSGCGKTTLIKTLSGFEISARGTIKVNNIAMNQLSEDFFQRKVSYHSANSRFIKGTLLENFKCYGVVDNNEIVKILKKCCPKLSICKENLDEKDVGDLQLSNGEKQKLLLELSLSKKPDIIFLDESTSFLPSGEAFEIISELKNNNKNSIIIMSTHDSALLALCNCSISLGKQSIKANSVGKVIRVTT
ncbi:TPA: ATP-binding cassette domain-containing protein [Vibrio cholerae]